MEQNKLKLKILLNEINSLKNLYDSKIEQLDCIKMLFLEEYKEKHIESKEEKIEETFNINDDVFNIKEEKIKENKIDKDIKKLYRSIVSKTHPDKQKEKNPEYDKIYLDVVKSYENNDVVSILLIAYKMNMDILNLNEELLNSIIDYKNNLKKSVDIFDYNNLMVWFNSTDENFRKILEKKIKNQLGI